MERWSYCKMLVCLQPLFKYKKKELYRHVESFELADPSLFEDAVVQENLSICLLKKNIVNKYDWMELTLKSFDQRFIEYYKWNIEHNKGIIPVRKDYKTPDMFDRNLDFVDTGRCFDATSHGHFSGPNSFGYKYNFYLKDWTNKDWGNILCVIHFQSKDAKDNFRAFAYAGNYQNNLAARCLSGVKTNMASSEYYFAIPQINWSNIHINQKELWDKGDYDNAVLSEMGLKFDENGVIVKC